MRRTAKAFSSSAAFESIVAAPSALVLRCETCGEVPHRILRGRIGGGTELVFEGVVRCSKCGQVRSIVRREPRPVRIPVIVSWLESSERTEIEFAPDELVQVGEELEFGESRIQVTAIEVADRRAQEAVAKDIATLWAKRVDKVRVRFSVSKGQRTVAHRLLAAPDEEFAVGEIVDLGKERAVIRHIRTSHRTVREGTVRADEIVRMYGRLVRERTSY